MLNNFLKTTRAKLHLDEDLIRIVHHSKIASANNGFNLSTFIADRALLYYRSLLDITNTLDTGVLTTVKETIAKIPDSLHFQSSHFGEIAACLFAEEVLQYKKIYCKLSLNTAENQNPHKMDLLLYKPNTFPVEFIFGEVKSSPKDSSDGLPAKHHNSCFADIFNSMRDYDENDKQFDLVTIKDNLKSLPQADQDNIKKSLLPYSPLNLSYIAMAIIDNGTFNQDETKVLGTRKSKKVFDVDLLCIENYKTVSSESYGKLNSVYEALKKALDV